MIIKNLKSINQWDKIILTLPNGAIYNQECVVLYVDYDEECKEESYIAFATYDENKKEILKGYIFQDFVENENVIIKINEMKS